MQSHTRGVGWKSLKPTVKPVSLYFKWVFCLQHFDARSTCWIRCFCLQTVSLLLGEETGGGLTENGWQFSPDISLTFGGLTSILQLDGIFLLLSNPAAEVLVLVATFFFVRSLFLSFTLTFAHTYKHPNTSRKSAFHLFFLTGAYECHSPLVVFHSNTAWHVAEEFDSFDQYPENPA